MRSRPLGVLLVCVVLSCSRKDAAPAGGANSIDAAAPAVSVASTAASTAARGAPIPSAKIAETVNPDGLAPYAGATGSVEGRVTVIGDPAPPSGLNFTKCPEAEAVYGRVFREGAPLADGARPLADALVVITGYKGFVAEKNEAKSIRIRGCAISPKTIDLTFGQRLEIGNDMGTGRLFAPQLANHPLPALMVAPHKAEPVKLWPIEPGFTQLIDRFGHEFLVSDVYTLLQPLHAVSAEDGTFRIDGIPVGKVDVNARLRHINRDVIKSVEVRANVVSRVDVTMEYKSPPPKPATSADAGPRIIIK
ncbi:MAG: carboxypeptidase regulatory-like domain-containing protein [Myxococcales bacterium]|nr:carboxypeptidase regulatory-like domain-containing protein [Myxococcales bacterium]